MNMNMLKNIYLMIRAIKNIENWNLFLADRLGFSKGEYNVYSFRNGLKFKSRNRSRDRGIISDIMMNKIYTPKELEIKPDDIIVDIGSQIGVFSVMAAKQAKKGRVYSFEPMPENFCMLNENIKLNKLSNIIAINKALCKKAGKKDFYLDKSNSGGHSLFAPSRDSKKIIVQSIALSRLIKKEKIKINFLKMDCEGGEYEILEDLADNNLLKNIEKISMEYHNIDNLHNWKFLLNTLQKAGFKAVFYGGKETGDTGMLYAKKII